jgi:hypothetical protein
MKTYSPLPVDALGNPTSRPPVFFRVERWAGRFIADFATKGEAEAFAIEDAKAKGCRFDHKVSTIKVR